MILFMFKQKIYNELSELGIVEEAMKNANLIFYTDIVSVEKDGYDFYYDTEATCAFLTDDRNFLKLNKPLIKILNKNYTEDLENLEFKCYFKNQKYETDFNFKVHNPIDLNLNKAIYKCSYKQYINASKLVKLVSDAELEENR